MNDLQGHLLAIAHEVKDLRDRVAGIDQLQGDIARSAVVSAAGAILPAAYRD